MSNTQCPKKRNPLVLRAESFAATFRMMCHFLAMELHTNISGGASGESILALLQIWNERLAGWYVSAYKAVALITDMDLHNPTDDQPSLD